MLHQDKTCNITCTWLPLILLWWGTGFFGGCEAMLAQEVTWVWPVHRINPWMGFVLLILCCIQWNSAQDDFHPLWAVVEESVIVLVVICWHSGCCGISLLPDYWIEIIISPKSREASAEKCNMWNFRLTVQENADGCFGGLVDKEVDLQFSTWEEADLLPANSGKSFILTSNGTKSDFAGFDLPAEFGADRAPRKPVVQIETELEL